MNTQGAFFKKLIMIIDHENKIIKADQSERIMVANYVIYCIPDDEANQWRVMFNNPIEVRNNG